MRTPSTLRLNTVNLTFDGRTQCLADWSRELGINQATLAKRLARGWSAELALTHLQPRKGWRPASLKSRKRGPKPVRRPRGRPKIRR